MKPVTVVMPPELNLEQCQKILSGVLGKLGCQACCSGFNISLIERMKDAVDPAIPVFSVDKNLQITDASLRSQ